MNGISMRMKHLGIFAILSTMAIGASVMACPAVIPAGCSCVNGKVVVNATQTTNVNSGNSTTNKNTYNTSTNQVNSNNTDKSIHNTATGGAGGSAKQHQSQQQQIANSGNASLSNVGNASATATAAATANNSGNNVGAGNSTNVEVQGANYRAPRIPVSTAYAAALTSGADTCLGSMSGGAQTMPVGISIGGTKKDENCIFIKKAHLLKELSDRLECFFIRAHDKDIDQAYREAGMECPSEAVIQTTYQDNNMDTSQFVTRDELNDRDRKIVRNSSGK